MNHDAVRITYEFDGWTYTDELHPDEVTPCPHLREYENAVLKVEVLQCGIAVAEYPNLRAWAQAAGKPCGGRETSVPSQEPTPAHTLEPRAF